MARLSGNIVTRRKLRSRGASFALRKRPWMMQLLKKMKKQRAKREYFVCRLCLHRIARIPDLLTRVLRLTTYGLFRRVFNDNVEEVLHYYEYPGFGNYFNGLYCRHCPAGTLLGARIVHVAQPGTVENVLYGPHWVPGNCLLQIFQLRIRKGNVLLDAITREVVGHI